MEYSCYQRVPTETQNQLIAKYQEEQAEQKKKEGK